MNAPQAQEDPFLKQFSFEGREAALFKADFETAMLRGIVMALSSIAFLVSLLAIAMFGFWVIPLSVLAILPNVWLNTALFVRRAHDVGWSGKWPLILMTVAMILMVGALVLLAMGRPAAGISSFLSAGMILLPMAAFMYASPGTPGSNRFGPDPRETK